MEEAITALLLGHPGITGMVGDRVNWSARPDDTDIPALTLHRVTGRRGATMTGRSDLESSTVQIDAWGKTFKEAKLLGRAVVTALPHSRTLTGGIVLQGIFIDGESDSFEGTDPVPLFRTRIDISVWHTAKEAEND